jgi:hypothetical protein
MAAVLGQSIVQDQHKQRAARQPDSVHEIYYPRTVRSIEISPTRIKPSR